MGRNLGKLPIGPLARLLELYEVDDLSALADAMGLPSSTVRNWHARGGVPAGYLLQAAQARNSSVDWLMEGIRPKAISSAGAPLLVKKTATATHLGEGVNKLTKTATPTHLGEGKQVAKTATPTHLPGEDLASAHVRKVMPAMQRLMAGAQDGNLVQDEVSAYRIGAIPVPIYALAASAGNGNGAPDHVSAESLIHFAPSYMRRHFGRVGDGFAMLYVKGDSMQPTLWDGDEIVIDTRERRVDRDGIYVVTVRSDLKVKRIQVKMDGSLVIKSDNAAYEPELIGAAQADEFQVEGRLVWPRLR